MSIPPPPQACVPIDQISSLTNNIVGGKIKDLAISANRDLSRIGMRVGFVDPPQGGDLVATANATYQAFFDGLLAPTHAGTDWSVYFGEELMLRLARVNAFNQMQPAMAQAGLAAFPDHDNHSPPWDQSWRVPPETLAPDASLAVYGRVNVVDCDVYFSVSADAAFEINPGTQKLQILGHFDYELEDIDNCGLDLLPGAVPVANAVIPAIVPSASFAILDNLCTVAAGHSFTRLSPSSSSRFAVNISSTSLPSDIRSLSFNLPLSTADVFLGFLPDFRNGALSFSGTASNLVDGGDGATVNPAQISLSAWINSRSSGRTAYETIVSKVNGTNRQYALGIARGGKLQLVAAGAQLDGATTVSANAWHHVVATYDGATMRLYLDGRLDASLASTARMIDSRSSVTAGGQRGSTGTLPFNGTLDEVRIYDVALSAVQAASNDW